MTTPTDAKIPMPVPTPYSGASSDEKNPLDTPDVTPGPPQVGEKAIKGRIWLPHYSSSLLLLFAILVMLIWPWAFYGAVHHRGGTVMNAKAAKVVRKNPQDTDYFVTALASAIAWIVGYLFSTSVTTLSRKRVVFENTDVFRISFFSALKNREFVWPVGTLPFVFKSWSRLRLVLAVVAYIVVFILVTPGITALLHPQTLIRQVNLTAAEPDFGSSNPDCLEWYNTINLRLPQTCGWTSYNGFQFTTCLGEDQMIDALESGRNNIQSLHSKDAQSFTFPQLNGSHFLGPIQGILPIGPNGIPAFGNVSALPSIAFEVPDAYNYTFNLQGLTSNISCAYSTESIVSLAETTVPTWSRYVGTCPSGKEILNNPQYPVALLPALSNNTMGFWACLASEPGDLQESYDIYLYGLPTGAYGNMTGNITCNVPAFQSAEFPVKYTNATNFFQVESPSTLSQNLSTVLMRNAIIGIGEVIWGAQQSSANFVGESVITFGVREFNLQPNFRDDKYPQLYAAMLQGLLEYEATYLRMLYSTNRLSTLAPSDCQRTVTGWVEYPVIGWEVGKRTAAYLIPLTIINLTSLIFILAAMFTIKSATSFDPTNPVSLIVAASGRDLHAAMEQVSDPADPKAWEYLLKYDQKQGRFSVLPEAV